MTSEQPGAEFKMVGGHLCLDFTNTISGHDKDGGVLVERLVEFGDLVRWSRTANPHHVSVKTPAEGGVALVRRARALREAIYRVLTAHVDGRRPVAADLELLNAEISRARGHERLAAAGGGFAWQFEKDAAGEGLLWPVVRSLGDLLVSEDLARVRRCDGEDCGWLFLDISRNGRRRWCDMADCGNLAKVRRFRARR